METGKLSFERNRSAFYSALIYEFVGSTVITFSFSLTRKEPFLRSVVYLAMYLFAVHISGAHFNPATSFAVYLSETGLEKRKSNLRYFLCVVLVQVLGAYLGVLIIFLLVKDYNLNG
jgi:glycerol uptake facilitator-like aquaporin